MLNEATYDISAILSLSAKRYGPVFGELKTSRNALLSRELTRTRSVYICS